MSKKVKDILLGFIGGFGFLLILSVAGSDCGGSCMEDAMSLATNDVLWSYWYSNDNVFYIRF